MKANAHEQQLLWLLLFLKKKRKWFRWNILFFFFWLKRAFDSGQQLNRNLAGDRFVFGVGSLIACRHNSGRRPLLCAGPFAAVRVRNWRSIRSFPFGSWWPFAMTSESQGRKKVSHPNGRINKSASMWEQSLHLFYLLFKENVSALSPSRKYVMAGYCFEPYSVALALSIKYRNICVSKAEKRS